MKAALPAARPFCRVVPCRVVVVSLIHPPFHFYTLQSVEKGKLTAEAAAAESKAVEGRIKYSMNLEDLKDADLVIEVCN